jgi:HK97 family phage prohead protease
MYDIKTTKSTVLDIDIPSRIVKVRIAAFGNVDSDGDIIAEGSAIKSVTERGPNGKNDIFHLWQHRTDSVLGKPKEIILSSEGMDFVTPITTTTLGMDVLKLYADGVIDNHSIGFQTINTKQETVNGIDVRIITEMKVWEGSSVTWGANSMTPFMGFKSAERIEYLTEKINKLRKALNDGKYSDDIFRLLNIELLQIETLIKENRETTHQDQPQPSVNDFLNMIKF